MDKIDFNKIELLVLDVDGVLTDGKIILTPTGQEVKAFSVRDGSGMKFWKRSGKKLAIITGRGSPAVEIRAKDLDVDCVRLNAKNKLPAYQEVLAELNVSADQTAVVGDDLPDLPLLRRCAFSVAPADAVQEVRAQAMHVTSATGGNGAVRETIELIMKNTGAWKNILARYIDGGEEIRV